MYIDGENTFTQEVRKYSSRFPETERGRDSVMQ